ncbi:MAG TPA: hypothetical protein VFH36_00065 [Acidimicrobiales bacterium]|nr:hypothetical protein [Acidimicrobiales bacterium]
MVAITVVSEARGDGPGDPACRGWDDEDHRQRGFEARVDELSTPDPEAERSCPMCGGTGWVPEWNRSCPSDRHRSVLELTWWAFEDGWEQLQAACARAIARRTGVAS